MDEEQAIRILKPLFWRIGKSNGEQLWIHQFTVWYALKRMMNIGAFPKLQADKQEILEASCLLHDLKKSMPWNQLILSGESNTEKIVSNYVNWWKTEGVKIEKQEKARIGKLFENGRTDHQIETERDFQHILMPYLTLVEKDLPFRLTVEKARVFFDIIKHHFLREQDISEASLPGFGNYIYILKLCDRLASMETVDVNTIDELRNINRLGRRIFDVTYFTISRAFGPSTALALDVLSDAYKDRNWTPLLYFEDGGVFVTKGRGELPGKNEIVENTFQLFLEKSLQFARVQYGTRDLLSGVASDHPRRFLSLHRDRIVRDLNQDDAGIAFFKFLVAMLTTDDHKETEIRDRYPLLDILFGLTVGTRGIPLAGKRWQEAKGKELPQKEGGGVDKRASLNYIFNNVSLSEVIPAQSLEKLGLGSASLKDCSSSQLFEILSDLAGTVEKETERDLKMKTYFGNVISTEEEKDFREIAQERFEEYKRYKQKPQDEKTGVCEICGSVVTQKPGAGFPKGEIQAFTQIKARADIPRKVCPLCDYDNNMMRQDVGTYIPIYAKIHSRIPLGPFRKEIREQTKVIRDGIIRIQNIENMEKRWGILFPSVPIVVGESKYDIMDSVSTKDGMEMVLRLERVPRKDFSPKDQKAKYEPLYHLLSLLGFQVSIGREEQIGLFGERISTTEQNYYKSLATVLLRSTIGKKRGYVFARDLLEKSPSVAIVYACQESEGDERKFLKLKEPFAKKFFEYLYKSGIVLWSSKGGEYKMENLLEDAAFFASGIPKFCWAYEDWTKWSRGASKHLVAKPISQTLNEMLQGRSFDEAFARFLSHIREDIAKEKSEKAATDVKELGAFVKEAKVKLQKYYELKRGNITQFIRVKNALLSAVYVFKRYENLRGVAK